MNSSLCLAQAEDKALDADTSIVPEPSSRELLLYLGEFDPELDPVELSQISDAPEGELEIKSDAKTAVEARADAANERKK